MRLVLVVVGALLIVVGALAFAGVGLTTNKAKVEVGPFEASVEEKRVLPPAVAGLAIVAGIALLAVGAKRSR